MPAFLEARLKDAAAAKGLAGKKADRYVYGAMNNLGAMRGNQETQKGKRMEKKHREKIHGDGVKMRTLSELA
jgi:hypothetical protein